MSNFRWVGGCGVVLVVLALMFVPSGHATVLPPGECAGASCPLPVYSDFPSFSGAAVADTGTEAFTGKDFFGNTVFTGNFRELVIADPVTGFLDFLYQIQQTGGPDSIGRLTTVNYNSSLTDVGTCSGCSDLIPAVGPSHIAPQFVGRSSLGDQLTFDFGGSIFTQIGNLNESDVLVIKTNATQFASGSSSIIDGGVASVASLAPGVVSAPEPSSLLLSGLGIGGLMLLLARRRIHIA
jgi:hypothetical protein